MMVRYPVGVVLETMICDCGRDKQLYRAWMRLRLEASIGEPGYGGLRVSPGKNSNKNNKRDIREK